MTRKAPIAAVVLLVMLFSACGITAGPVNPQGRGDYYLAPETA